MNLAPSGFAFDNEMDNGDKINAMIEVRKLLPNASYYRLIKTVQDALMFDKSEHRRSAALLWKATLIPLHRKRI